MHVMRRTAVVLCVTATVALAGPAVASAANIAVFDDNAIDNFLTAQGHTTTLVTGADLATPGFLTAFDVFVHTRDGTFFGGGLSPQAAAQVSTYAKRVVALNGDFADSLPGASSTEGDPQAVRIVANSADWAAVGSGGVIGEFNGAVSLLDANSNGFTPLGLITGSAGPLGSSLQSTSMIDATAVGATHPVLDGVALPDDPEHNEFEAAISGADSTQVLARYSIDGNPAILARIVNTPPNCSGLTTSPRILSPANNKLRTITISGATDADGDPLTYSITNVKQDEPVDAHGQGERAPDAQLVSGTQVKVRAERSGGGNGRVYEISVSVADDAGATCTGTVTVAVPHDRSGTPAVNDGASHPSL